MQKYVFVLFGVLAFALTGCNEDQVVGTVTEESKVLVEDKHGNVTNVNVVTVVDDANNVRVFTSDGSNSTYVNDRFIFTIKHDLCPIDDVPRITRTQRIDKEVPKMKHNEAKATLMAKHLNGNKIDLAANDKMQRLEEENIKLKERVSELFAHQHNRTVTESPTPVVYGPTAD